MRIFKRLAAILLCAAVSLAALPISGALTATADTTTLNGVTLTYTVSNGAAKITDVDASISGDIIIPSELGGYTVTSIGDFAFYNCTSLTSITIPDSVTSIGRYAFRNCTSLTSITVGENNSTYSSLNGVLFDKEKTNLICYPAGKNGEYTIPDSVTSIGRSAFSDCTGLESITIPDSVTSIGGWAFEYCTSLESITIPDSVTSIGGWAFEYCTSLTSITVGENNSAYSSLNGVLFDKEKTNLICCPAGKSGEYTIPDSVTSIGDSAFENCRSLTSITIPDGVTSIGFDAFSGCTSLESITIPDGVTNIGDDAFYNCTSLTDVYYTGTEDEWNSIFIGICNTCLTNATIHCNYTPSTSVLGDLNGDGSITADDLAAMRKAILTGETAVNADMNIDGVVNIKDLIALKKLLA